MTKQTNGTASKRTPSPAGSLAGQNTEYGQIKIHEGAIATIVRKAACSVDGVTRITGSSFVDNLAEIVGSKKMQDRSIAIEMGDNSVQVEIKVILAYGTHIPEVGREIQLAVIREISAITGMQVSKVNVIIIDLEDEQEQSGEE